MMKDDKPCVYVITNTKTKERYFGSTSDFKQRVKTHMRTLRSGTHQNLNLQKAFDREDNFTFKVLKRFDTYEEAFNSENELIAKFIGTGKLYNICGGNNPFDTYTHNPNRERIVEKRTETVKKMYANMTPEERAERWDVAGEKNPMFGKTHSDEVKQRLRERMLGTVPPNKGKPMPEHQYEQMCKRMRDNADSMKGEGNHFYGKTHSEETKQRLREAATGRLNGQEVNVSIDGVVYDSISRAAKALNMVIGTVRFRVRSDSPKFSEWKAI